MKNVRNTQASAKKASITIVLPDDQVRLKDFLTDDTRKGMLSISGIERLAGLSQGIVSKFVHGKKALHPKQLNKLLPVIKMISYPL